MINKSCVLKPTVEDRNGNFVESKLWKDLYNLTNKDYNRTYDLYLAATSKSFLATVGDKAKYDENGQITAHSFLKLAEMNDELSEEYKRLADNYNGKVEQTKLDGVVTKFNGEQAVDDYVPRVKSNGESYNVTIVRRTEDAVEELENMLEKDRLTNKLRDRLKSLGVAYDFVGRMNYNGRFSTENAKLAVDGLHHLIELSTGTDNVNDALVEEAAHLAVVATRDSTLTARLINAINNLIEKGGIEHVFTKEELDAARQNPNYMTMELAGVLVKKSMQRQGVGMLGNIVSNVRKAIYNIFSKLVPTEIEGDIAEAKRYAEAIANGFIHNEDMFDVKNALKRPMNLYSLQTDNDNVDIITRTMRRISVFNNKMMQASYAISTGDDVLKLRPGELLDGKQSDSADAIMASEVVANSLDAMLDIFKTNWQTIQSIDANDFVDQNVTKNDVDLFIEVFEAHKAILDICDYFDTFASKAISDILADPNNPNLKPNTKAKIETVRNNISNIRQEFLNGNVASKLLEYGRKLVASQLEVMYGKESITLASRVVFDGLATTTMKERTASMGDLATKYLSDYSYDGSITNSISSYIRSRKFSRDALTQFMDKAARRNRIMTMRYRNDKLEELNDIQRKIKKYNIDVRTFYEKIVAPPVVDVVTDKNTGEEWYAIGGKKISMVDNIMGFPVVYDNGGEWYLDDTPTYIKVDYNNKTNSGYFISGVKKGQYVIDARIMERRVKSEFLKDLKVNGLYAAYQNKTATEKYQEFLSYREKSPIYTKFINDAFRDVDNKIYSDKYVNDEFDAKSHDKQWLEVYNDIIEYKNSVDQTCLVERESFDGSSNNDGKKHYVKNKIPQYRKGFIGKYISHRLDKSDLYNGEFTRYLCEDVTSDDFGDITTQSKLTPFNDPIYLYEDGMRRLPISGINDLHDMRELSEDLVGSLSAYTDMAYRFFGAQQIYSTMLNIDNVADAREAGDFSEANKINIKGTAKRERDTIMNTFIYGSEKRKTLKQKIVNAISKFGSWVAIRLLAISFIPAIKNKIGGLTVFMKDALTGAYGFNAANLLKAILQDTVNPRHWLGTILSKITNKDISWDKYQKLTKRFDNFRNPTTRNKTTHRYSPFNHIINVMMSNYEVTDTSLIAIMYRTGLKSRHVYDANTGERVTLEKTYKYDKDGNPILMSGFVKDGRNVRYYNLLKEAIDRMEEIIEFNDDDSNNQKMRFEDYEEIKKLDAYINNAPSLAYKFRPDIKFSLSDNNGFINTSTKLLDEAKAEFDRISYTLDDEIEFINNIDDYIALSQGYYGMINASMFQLTNESKEFAKLKGWLFAFMQRDFLTNASLSRSEIMEGIFKTQALALATIFLPRVDADSGIKTFWKGDAGFRMSMFIALCMPFALKSQKFRARLVAGGWDPSQLLGLSFAAIGWAINAALIILAKLFRRGNRRSIGKTMLSPESRREGKHNKYRKPGVFGGFEYLDEEKNDEDIEKWFNKGFPMSMSQKSLKNIHDFETLDFDAYEYSELRSIKNPQAGDIVYVTDRGMHYKYYDSKSRKGWLPYELGYYDEDTKEWNDHLEAINMSNIKYDTDNPMYYICGAMYRLLRGVSSEAMTINDPIAMTSEISDIANAVIFNGGAGMLWKGVDALTSENENEVVKWEGKLINFWLNKGFWELDGPGKVFTYVQIDGQTHMITWKDEYEAQDRVDRYRKTNNKIGIPRLEDLFFRQ